MMRTEGDERGATAVEYALMVAGVAVLIVTAVATFGMAVSNLFVAEWPWN